MPSRSLSIGIVTSTLSRSGGGIFPIVRAHARGLASLSSASVTVYGVGDDSTEQDLSSWQPVVPRVYRPRLRRFGYVPRMGHDLRRGGHDIVHQHGLWLYPSIATLRWQRESGRPSVISTQGMLEPWALENSASKKRLASLAFERSNLARAACIHCSEGEVAGVRAYGLRNPIAVIPNGVELPGEGASQARPSWMPPGRRILLFLGRLHPKKGLTELLHAWARLRQSSPELAAAWTLGVAGWDDGGHLAQLTALAKELRFGANEVAFPGPLFEAAKEAALWEADAFVLPSHSEGFPMAVLEAWAHSLPVLMTRACNLSAAFQEGAAVEVSTDPSSLAPQLAAILSQVRLEEMGARGREMVSRKYAWNAIVGQLLEVYEWLVGRGNRPNFVIAD